MAISCNRCGRLPFAGGDVRSGSMTCPMCGAENIIRVFPALFSARTESAAAARAADGEAACYDHPGKQAIAHCSQCGRYVCQLCSVEFRQEIWCPGCMAAGVSGRHTLELEQSRVLYDTTAVALATAPIILWPLTIIGGPASLYVAIRYWSKPLSLIRRYRWRTILAIVIASAEIIGWIWLAVYIAVSRTPRT